MNWGRRGGVPIQLRTPEAHNTLGVRGSRSRLLFPWRRGQTDERQPYSSPARVSPVVVERGLTRQTANATEGRRPTAERSSPSEPA